MNFKESLIAHLQGEKVEVLPRNEHGAVDWKDFGGYYEGMPLEQMARYVCDHQFRLAPRTILVNGVEVPAPEKDAPAMHSRYYVPSVIQDDYYAILEWKEHKQDLRALEDGVIYLNKEDAIARAKAMLLTQSN